MKKILLYFPDNLDEAIQCLPSIDILRDSLEFDELNILGKNDLGSLINYIYSGVNYFKLPKEKMNVFDIHKYAVNLNTIFNIDVFFDFQGTFQSAFTGYSFRSVDRIGFKGGIKSFLYNKPIESLVSGKQNQVVKLIQGILPKCPSDLKKTIDTKSWDKESPFFTEGLKDLTDVTIAMPKIEDVEPYKIFLKEFFDELEEKQIRFLFWEDKKENSGAIEEWYNNLNQKNKYYFDFFDMAHEVISLTKKTKVFFTTEPWIGTLACIMAIDPIVLSNGPVPLIEHPLYVGRRKSLEIGKNSKIFLSGTSLELGTLVDKLSEDYFL